MKMSMKRTLITFLTLGSLAASLAAARSPEEKGRSADVQAIKSTEEQWNKEYQNKDVDAVCAHYADNATLMAPGMPATMGKEAICASLKQMVGDSAFALTFQERRVEVSKSGDLGFSEGSYKMTMTDPTTKKTIDDKGSYVTVYRKQSDGTWKAVSDIATSELPVGSSGK
jgi:ketosteroid isomerase-like protein